MYTIPLNTTKGQSTLKFATKDDVFMPTATSKVIIDACLKEIDSPRKMLDLGCGSGVVGLSLAHAGLCRGALSASDLSESAVELAKENARELSIDIDARSGSLFEPWLGERFDVIVDDVAGISDEIAARSSWYPDGVSCDAGRDGTRWILKIIEESPEFLEDGGALIFPVISLSNEKKIIEMAESVFNSCSRINSQDWFLPDEISADDELIRSLNKDGSINCQEKFGKWICTTSVYVAR